MSELHIRTAALVAIPFHFISHAWLHQGITAVHSNVRLLPSAAVEVAEGSHDLPQSNKCHVHLMATIGSVEASHSVVSMQMPIEAPVKLRKQHVQHVEYHRDMYGQARALPQPGDRVLDAQPAHRMEFWGADGDGDDIDAYSDGDFDAGAGPGFYVHTQRLHSTEDELRIMFSNPQCAGTVQPLWASQNKGVMLVSLTSGTRSRILASAHLPDRASRRYQLEEHQTTRHQDLYAFCVCDLVPYSPLTNSDLQKGQSAEVPSSIRRSHQHCWQQLTEC